MACSHIGSTLRKQHSFLSVLHGSEARFDRFTELAQTFVLNNGALREHGVGNPPTIGGVDVPNDRCRNWNHEVGHAC